MKWNINTNVTSSWVQTLLVNLTNHMIINIYQFKKEAHPGQKLTTCIFNDVPDYFMNRFKSHFQNVSFSAESKICPDEKLIRIHMYDEDQKEKMAKFLSTHRDFADDACAISFVQSRVLSFQESAEAVSQSSTLVVPELYHQGVASSSSSSAAGSSSSPPAGVTETLMDKAKDSSLPLDEAGKAASESDRTGFGPT